MRLDISSLRKVGIAGALIFGVTLSAAAQNPADMAGKTAEQAFKNIQVLKGIPADQVFPTMRFIRDALGGISCMYCHAGDDRASDEKPTKLMARKMIQMELDINKNTFNGAATVTCYTCHRGATEPVGTPMIPTGTAETAAPANQQAPALPTVDQILAKYVDALGGEQALHKVTSRVETGTAEVPGGGAPGGRGTQGAMEIDAKAPNLNVLVLPAGNNGTTTQGFDGSVSWTQDNRGRVTEAAGTDLARAKRTADFYEPVNLKQEYAKLVVRGTEKIGDQSTYRVDGFPTGDSPEQLYFDTQSGLLVRRIVVGPTPLGDDPTYTNYGDYRDAGDGVKVPFLVQTWTYTTKTTLHVQKVQDNTQIDGGKFNKPASKAAPAAGGQ
jgi:photosynthetic reaction center cytochrome c subunit